MMYNDIWMFEAYDLESVKTLMYNGFPLHKDVFCYDEKEGKIYARLRADEKYASKDPNKNTMCVGGPYYETIKTEQGEQPAYRQAGISEKSYCVGVTSEKDANVVLYGLTFETPGNDGVYVRANNVTVSNCWFKGCRSGVGGAAKHMYDTFTSENVTIEYCDWNLYPLTDNTLETIIENKDNGLKQFFLWSMKSSHGGIFDYEMGGCFTRAGKNWTLRNTKVSQCLDGLSYASGLKCYEKYPGTNRGIPAENLTYYENRFEGCIDNAIETEDWTQNVDIFDNEFYNCYAAFSWQPLGGIPLPTNIKLHHNLFYISKDYFSTMMISTMGNASALKIGSKIDYSRPWMQSLYDASQGKAVKTAVAKDKGLSIYNNTMYCESGFSVEPVGSSDGNTYFANNLMYVAVQADPASFRTAIKPGECMPDYNGYKYENNMYINNNCLPGTKMYKDKVTFTNGFGFDTLEDAGINVDGFKLCLNENSPGIGAGVQVDDEKRNTKDIGAIPYGQTWEIKYSPYAYRDVNCDGIINLSDLAKIAEKCGIKSDDEEYEPRCDLNFDNVIDGKDYALWGKAGNE